MNQTNTLHSCLCTFENEQAAVAAAGSWFLERIQAGRESVNMELMSRWVDALMGGGLFVTGDS
ncbi:MAG: hypothetical protein ACYSUC_09110 [Planctomycetota bacterium]